MAKRAAPAIFLAVIACWFGSLAQAHEKTVVDNCPNGEPGSVAVLSPLPGQSLGQGPVPLRIRASCPGEFQDVPFVIRVDGAGYYFKKGALGGHREGQLFVPHPDAGHYCCQTGGHGLLSYRLRVPRGEHILTISPGYQGTNLPIFDPIEFSFSLEGVLPQTGFAMAPWGVAAALLMLGGRMLSLTGQPDPARTTARKRRTLLATDNNDVRRLACSFAALALLLSGCARLNNSEAGATPCKEIMAGCTSERLPNVTLSADQTRRPLGSVEGFSLDGLIGFDEALKRGIEEGGLYKADTVQVTLGSADATKLRWGEGRRLFYAIDWKGGMCGQVGSRPITGSPAPPRCVPITAGTIIDAETGEFIVSGEESLPEG